MTTIDRYQNLIEKITRFRDERNWRQFHTLQALITSTCLETAELLELTQWQSTQDIDKRMSDPEFMTRLQEETADVLLYLLQIADKAGFDLVEAAHDKMTQNAEKYPIEKANNSAKKYSSL
jgi:NTP pyrophosphatase (non-canonical NTP hydrolase)